MLDPLTSPQACKDVQLLSVQLGRDDRHDGFADYFFGYVIEQPRGPRIPGSDPPSSVLLTIASAEDSTMAASQACACSARRCSLISRKINTTPNSVPSGSRIGAALSSIGTSRPSRDSRIVWFASPTTAPVWSTFWTGFSTGCRVNSFKMGKTSDSARPFASSNDHLMSLVATLLRKVRCPRVSVTRTTSPMLAKVTSRTWLC